MRLHALRRQSLGRVALRARRQLWVPSSRQVLSRILHDGNTAAWYQPGVGITGALNVSLWANWVNGTAGTAGDLAQATGANQPIYLSHVGANYAYLPAVLNNTLTTPNKTITGNFTLTLNIASNDYSPGDNEKLIEKSSGNDGFAVLWLITTGQVRLQIGDGVSMTDIDVVAAPGFTDGTQHTVTIAWEDGVGATFSYDGVQSGSQVPAAKTLTNAVRTFQIGTSTYTGKAYQVTLTNSGATTYYDMNPAETGELIANGATWTSSNGEVYTLNNTGATPAQIVASPSLLGNGTAHWMQSGAFTLSPPYTIISVQRDISWTSGDVSFDGRTANSFALQQITGTPQARMHDALADSGTISPVLNTWNIITASQAADGTTSLQLNNGTPVTATLSATAMAGFTAWATGAGLSLGNSQKKEVIGLTEVPSTAKLLRIKQLLGRLHGISI